MIPEWYHSRLGIDGPRRRRTVGSRLPVLFRRRRAPLTRALGFSALSCGHRIFTVPEREAPPGETLIEGTLKRERAWGHAVPGASSGGLCGDTPSGQL